MYSVQRLKRQTGLRDVMMRKKHNPKVKKFVFILTRMQSHAMRLLPFCTTDDICRVFQQHQKLKGIHSITFVLFFQRIPTVFSSFHFKNCSIVVTFEFKYCIAFKSLCRSHNVTFDFSSYSQYQYIKSAYYNVCDVQFTTLHVNLTYFQRKLQKKNVSLFESHLQNKACLLGVYTVCQITILGYMMIHILCGYLCRK